MSRKWRFLLLSMLIVTAGCGSIKPIGTSTPIGGSSEFFTQQSAPTDTPSFLVITPTAVVIPPVTLTPIVVPDTPDEDDGGLVRDIIQGFILPIWNFFLSLTVGTAQTLWIETGRAGGIGAQAGCCGLPAILLVLWIVRYYSTHRRGR
jgi:hypothetical protein